MANSEDLKSMNKMIKGEIYNSLRTALVSPSEGSKKSFMDEFIIRILEEAKHNPSGALGTMLAKQLMQEDIISSLDAQTEKLLAKDVDFLEYRIIKQLFKEQRDVLFDHFIRRKCIMCSRRAGKTELNVRMLVNFCVTPNTPCLYVNLTFSNAVNQTFDKILACAAAIELPVSRSSKADGFIEFANGSSIVFRGNTNKAEADKIRGFKYRLVIVDEAQSQGNMIYLMNEVIEPLLMDFDDSVLVLTGTPPRVRGTYFEKAWNSKEWYNYHWTMKVNPYIHNVDEALEKICNDKGLTMESDFIRREYLGEIAYDTEAQVFKGYKTYERLDDKFIPTEIVIGVDFGYADYNGIVTLAFNNQTQQAFVTKENKFNKATVSQIAEVVINHFEEAKKYLISKNPNADLSMIRIVTDNNEKSLCAELMQTYNLPAYPCYKYDKKLAISQLADWTRSGKILVPKDGYLTEEFDMTVYKRDDQDNILSEIDDCYHPDIADALLYASRNMWFSMGYELGGVSSEEENDWTERGAFA